MRTIPASFDPEVVAAIDARLDSIEMAEGVAIGLAVESGSRAWGFASPDSDYDCRFIYIRRRADYLSLWPMRDVIETPLEGLLDVNGWDLAKTLRLVVKGNAVVIEWLRSPIVYRGDMAFRDALEEFATNHAPVAQVIRHYLHLGQRQWAVHTADGEIRAKKLFYALRPAAALRWIRVNGMAIPPMHFPTLIEQCDAPESVAAEVARLIERKSATRELGTMDVPEAIAAFVEGEYALASARTEPEPSDPAVLVAADQFFRKLLDKFAPA